MMFEVGGFAVSFGVGRQRGMMFLVGITQGLLLDLDLGYRRRCIHLQVFSQQGCL